MADDRFRFGLSLGVTKGWATASYLKDLAPDFLCLDVRGILQAELRTWASRGKAAGAAIAVDPVNYFDQSPYPGPRPQYYCDRAPYGRGAQRSGAFTSDNARRAYAKPIVDHQRAVTDDIVIAPYFYADVGDAVMLDESLRMGSIAQGLLSPSGFDGELWTGLAIAEQWLWPGHRQSLLDAVADAGPEVLYLLIATDQRAWQPLYAPSTIEGLERVIAAQRERGGSVIVGRRYSSGLLAGALGAAGWTTGCDGERCNFVAPPLANPTPGGGPAAPWYYVLTLLNSIKLATRASLLSSHGPIMAPSTSYATSLFTGNPALTTVNTAQRLLLHRHNVKALRDQAAALAAVSPVGRRPALKAQVAAAMTAYPPVSALPDAGEKPTFLPEWDAVL